MSTHRAEIYWQRHGENFLDGRYSRRHELRFATSVRVVGTASPAVVPIAYCDPDAVDPEAAFVASLAGCHMLWFLSLAAAEGYRVDAYQDAATGLLGRNAEDALAIIEVTLAPRVRFDTEHAPGEAAHRVLHERAHAQCFIARSVRCEMQLNPTLERTLLG